MNLNTGFKNNTAKSHLSISLLKNQMHRIRVDGCLPVMGQRRNVEP